MEYKNTYVTNPNSTDARAKFWNVGGSFLLLSGLADGDDEDGGEDKNRLLQLVETNDDGGVKRLLFVA
jgi:hypothetical protein